MPHIIYVNGRYLHRPDAQVHVEDRGFQLSDGVYEVCLFLNGQPLDFHPHMDRLERSLVALSIKFPVKRRAIATIMAQLLRRNRLQNALVYLQVTRGVARRDHAFPNYPVTPSLVITARRFSPHDLYQRQMKGADVITTSELRWKRCDIKSVSLLGNVLAKQEAKSQGAMEAWLIDENGCITEGASSTAWIIDQKGQLRTHHLDHQILPGITREVILSLAKDEGLRIVEAPFSLNEALMAQEAFLASSSAGIMPVTAINGQAIAKGRPGKHSQALIRRHWQHVSRETGFTLDQVDAPKPSDQCDNQDSAGLCQAPHG